MNRDRPPRGDENGHQPGDVPPNGQLDHGETDMSGAAERADDLLDVIGDAIVEARSQDAELPDWGARAVGRYLASFVQKSCSSALNHFAATARADYEQLAQELADLWAAGMPDLSEGVQQMINYLGTYFIARQASANRPAGPSYRDETLAAIDEEGPAFAAILLLPDVNEDNARELFHETYYDSFGSLDETAERIAQEHEVWQLLDDAGLAHVASPDPTLLLAIARGRWDIVPYNGRFYLFEK